MVQGLRFKILGVGRRVQGWGALWGSRVSVQEIGKGGP